MSNYYETDEDRAEFIQKHRDEDAEYENYRDRATENLQTDITTYLSKFDNEELSYKDLNTIINDFIVEYAKLSGYYHDRPDKIRQHIISMLQFGEKFTEVKNESN